MADAQLVSRVDFVGVPTRDLEAAVEFYGSTLGLPRSAYVKERNYAEFETGNVTLSVFSPEQFGLDVQAERRTRWRCTSRTSRGPAPSSRPAACSSRATRSTRASATWRSSPTRTATR